MQPWFSIRSNRFADNPSWSFVESALPIQIWGPGQNRTKAAPQLILISRIENCCTNYIALVPDCVMLVNYRSECSFNAGGVWKCNISELLDYWSVINQSVHLPDIRNELKKVNSTELWFLFLNLWNKVTRCKNQTGRILDARFHFLCCSQLSRFHTDFVVGKFYLIFLWI